MSKRTLRFDSKGLYFTVQMLLGVAVIAGAWYAWVPMRGLLFADAEGAVSVGGGLEEDSALDETERELTIERLLSGADTTSASHSVSSVYRYVPEKGRFISIDTVSMEVVLYEDGSRVGAVSIRRVPTHDAPNTLREGDFTTGARTDMEVSTLTMTRFPHYVRFGDGFALHGVPSDEQGAVLGEGYAGGSVELADEDAERVFDFVATSTPLHVRIKSITPPYAPFKSLRIVGKETPATSAYAYAVADLSRGQIVFEKNAGKVRPIASITKLFTASVASEHIGQGDELRAPSGEYYVLGDLLYPLLLRSDNEVAATIATHAGTRAFIADMNNYVRTLGMPVTSFADASGLSPRNVSSAFDLTTFARHLYIDRRYVLDLSREGSMTITSTAGVAWSMKNQNKLASDPHFVGGKLGFTDEAGQTALSIFNIPIDGEMRTIAVVILGSSDWKQDTRTLLRWLLENVEVQG